MIQAPPRRPTKWWQRRDWRQYAENLFRYYSHRRNYTLTLDPDTNLIAAVQQELKHVILNPNFPAPRETSSVRHTPVGGQRTTTMLKGLLAHEAAHVRYSCQKPSGLLGQVWNALEDERIERLMAQDHPDLGPIFTYLGDTMLTQQEPKSEAPTALEGCLLWRWLHDRDPSEWACSEPQAWEAIKPLVEAAWEAGTSEEVVELSRRILDLLDIDENAPADDDGMLNQPSATGAGSDPTEETHEQEDTTAGGGVGDEPEAPEVDPGTPEQRQADLILAEVESLARALAQALTPPPAKRLPLSSRSRGRFDYGRYYQGSERAFRYRAQDRPRQLEVRMLHDNSASMGAAHQPGTHQHTSIRAAMMLHRACELAGAPFTHHTFRETTPELVVTPGMDAEVARAKIANIQSGGMTYLAPSLQQAARDNQPHTILFLLCDGQLTEQDAHECARITKRIQGQVVPLLIGNATEALEGFKRIFGRAQPVSNVADLPRVIKTYLEVVAA